MWIRTGGVGPITSAVREHLTTLRREDRTDHAWVNLDSGALLRLTCIGGWRDAENAYYHLFLYAPNCEPQDVTYGILGTNKVLFETDPGPESDSYSLRRAAAIKTIDERIGASVFFESES